MYFNIFVLLEKYVKVCSTPFFIKNKLNKNSEAQIALK